jgi:hypothetical protein
MSAGLALLRVALTGRQCPAAQSGVPAAAARGAICSLYLVEPGGSSVVISGTRGSQNGIPTELERKVAKEFP